MSLSVSVHSCESPWVFWEENSAPNLILDLWRKIWSKIILKLTYVPKDLMRYLCDILFLEDSVCLTYEKKSFQISETKRTVPSLAFIYSIREFENVILSFLNFLLNEWS